MRKTTSKAYKGIDVGKLEAYADRIGQEERRRRVQGLIKAAPLALAALGLGYIIVVFALGADAPQPGPARPLRVEQPILHFDSLRFNRSPSREAGGSRMADSLSAPVSLPVAPTLAGKAEVSGLREVYERLSWRLPKPTPGYEWHLRLSDGTQLPFRNGQISHRFVRPGTYTYQIEARQGNRHWPIEKGSLSIGAGIEIDSAAYRESAK